jgi:hypothetical protein
MHDRIRPARPLPTPDRPDRAAVAGDHRLLDLQRSAGNAAVQSLSVQRDARADAARTARLSTALSRGELEAAGTILQEGEQAWMVDRLKEMSIDQLRLLDDAIRRAGQFNTVARRMVIAVITLKAQAAGRPVGSAKPGAAYGTIHGEVEETNHGRLVPGGANDEASCKFGISFTPDPAVVKSTLIEFIQVAKVVSTTNSAADPVGVQVPANAGANGRHRQTADHSRVDRITGKKYGWYGVDDDNTASDHLQPWTPGSSKPAYMSDTPSRSVPNVDFHFETAAVSRQGPDAGTIYATIVWGFTIDANMQVVAKEPIYYNKESKDFDLAVAFWSGEAANSGGAQTPLPDALR